MEKNDKEEFFDEKEKKEVGKHPEEMDTSFVEPESHHFFAKFLIFILILLIGGICTYYFVLNTPKKTYTTIINKLSKNTSILNTNKNNYNYKINANILSNDKDTQKVLDIVNKIELSGIINYNNDIIKGTNNIKYKDGELLDITYSLDLNNNTIYLKLNDILNKVIKLDVNKETKTSKDINKDDYIKLINSIIKNIKLSLENANYKREITKLNNNFVFKETLLLDEKFSKELLTKLLHDDEFISSYSKIYNMTNSEVTDELNQELANIKDEKESISIYKTILKDEILKIEILSEDNNVTINKEDNKYNYEIINDNELVYKGFIKIYKENNENKEIVNIELLKEKINLELNITYSKNNNNILELDTNNSIDINSLTEDDLNKIMQYIENNKTVKELLNDTGLSKELNDM